MKNWIFGKQPDIPSDTEKALRRDVDRLKAEYLAIDTSSVDNCLQKFAIVRNIVALLEPGHIIESRGYSGEIVCDYNQAVYKVIVRLTQLMYLEMKFPNEHLDLEQKAFALFRWRDEHRAEWWRDEQPPYAQDKSRAEVEELVAAINKKYSLQP